MCPIGNGKSHYKLCRKYLPCDSAPGTKPKPPSYDCNKKGIWYSIMNGMKKVFFFTNTSASITHLAPDYIILGFLFVHSGPIIKHKANGSCYIRINLLIHSYTNFTKQMQYKHIPTGTIYKSKICFSSNVRGHKTTTKIPRNFNFFKIKIWNGLVKGDIPPITLLKIPQRNRNLLGFNSR